jgi:tetratricopeptide (TPR) repeat protein
MRPIFLSIITIVALNGNEINNSMNDNNESVILADGNITKIENSINNNRNTIVLIFQRLNQKPSKELIDTYTRDMVYHFNQIHIDLKKFKHKESFIEYLETQVKEAMNKGKSFKEQLDKAQKQREEQLAYIDELRKSNTSLDYQKVLDEAREALLNYDSPKYHRILGGFQKTPRLQKDIKDKAHSHFMRANEYYKKSQYKEAIFQMEEAIRFDNQNMGYYQRLINSLIDLKMYKKASEIIEKGLEDVKDSKSITLLHEKQNQLEGKL